MRSTALTSNFLVDLGLCSKTINFLGFPGGNRFAVERASFGRCQALQSFKPATRDILATREKAEMWDVGGQRRRGSAPPQRAPMKHEHGRRSMRAWRACVRSVRVIEFGGPKIGPLTRFDSHPRRFPTVCMSLCSTALSIGKAEIPWPYSKAGQPKVCYRLPINQALAS